MPTYPQITAEQARRMAAQHDPTSQVETFIDADVNWEDFADRINAEIQRQYDANAAAHASMKKALPVLIDLLHNPDVHKFLAERGLKVDYIALMKAVAATLET